MYSIWMNRTEAVRADQDEDTFARETFSTFVSPTFTAVSIATINSKVAVNDSQAMRLVDIRIRLREMLFYG